LVFLYNNNFTSIIDIYYYETFSTSNLIEKALALHSLYTLSDVRIKSVYASLLIKTLSIPNSSLTCLLLLLSVVNNFYFITSFSFNYLVVIIVCTAFESSALNLI
jgi:hypothetical protein